MHTLILIFDIIWDVVQSELSILKREIQQIIGAQNEQLL